MQIITLLEIMVNVLHATALESISVANKRWNG